jgi:trans-aconitate methyltransferase
MSDSEFRDVFVSLVRATDEYTKLVPVMREEIVPTLPRTEALLDVGAGPGLIAGPLSADFGEVTIIEPDPVYCLESAEKILAQGKLMTAFNGSWEAAPLGKRAFDLVVCSHVLYFVEPAKWSRFIDKMMSHLRQGGQLAVILVARDDDSNALIRQSLDIQEVGSYPFSAAVVEYFESQGYNFDVLTFEANISAETPQQLLDIMALFPILQYDTKGTDAQRLEMIQRHFSNGEAYRMPYAVDIVTASAP